MSDATASGAKQASSEISDAFSEANLVRPINQEVILSIPGCTELMKACRAVDLGLVVIAIRDGADVSAVDEENNSARRYAWAGYNEQMRVFWALHPDSDSMHVDLMSEADQEAYLSLTERLHHILQLLADNVVLVS